jgi:uncharacterized Zn-binding protein involved in type VI secretion
MSGLSVRSTPKEPPAPPANPARVLQQGIGKVMATINAPADLFNEGFAKATAGLAAVWPTFPAATMLSLAVGLPHSHATLPLVVLPVIGSVLVGCCVSVLINGIPAARVGDMGLNPTCLGAPLPGFEIFTGSSKVFIGGARAARMFDITKHCWPPPPKWKPSAAMAKVVSGANKAMTGMMVAGMSAQAIGVVADGMDAASAEDPAVASAHALAAGMGAAQLAMDAASLAFGAMVGKNPCIGSPTGAILLGAPNVLVGGFPMPSGMAMLQRKLAGAELPPKKRWKNDENHQGNESCK